MIYPMLIDYKYYTIKINICLNFCFIAVIKIFCCCAIFLIVKLYNFILLASKFKLHKCLIKTLRKLEVEYLRAFDMFCYYVHA